MSTESGAGSGQHLASVLQEGRENANIDAGLGFICIILVEYLQRSPGGLGGHLMTASGTPTSDAALPNAILAVLAHIVRVTHLLRG